MGEKSVNFEAWAKSAVGYIKARKLESDFSDWCGGWKPPFGTDPCDPDPSATMKEVVEVLEFYANPEIYKPHPHGLAFERRDKSDMARSILARLGMGS
jgi:hypothetical protein